MSDIFSDGDLVVIAIAQLKLRCWLTFQGPELRLNTMVTGSAGKNDVEFRYSSFYMIRTASECYDGD